ncbi:MAG: selenium-dependent molybdenum cofactor biosynthesis protein YqeB [Anaerolineales bacterium]
MSTKPRALIRGGGDLGSGVAARLHRVGFEVMVAEIEHPLVVRRLVSFAEAIFSGQVKVEEIVGRMVTDLEEASAVLRRGEVAVMVDPELICLELFSPLVLVDARMRKRPPEIGMEAAPFVVGLGPGFSAGDNCHAVIETMRGHRLGRVIWEGEALPNTGIPDTVAGKSSERVLRAPKGGVLRNEVQIGEQVQKGEIVASVADAPIRAPFSGVLRGMIQEGLTVTPGMKIGDLDPRNDPEYARMISDKSLAIAGGVLEAIFSRKEIRDQVYAPD